MDLLHEKRNFVNQKFSNYHLTDSDKSLIIKGFNFAIPQDTAFTSYSTFNKDNGPPFKFSKDESESLCKLKNENKLVIQKADKGNAIVILDKDNYLKSVETLFKDSSKFKNIHVAPDKDLNYIINSVKRVIDLLKKFRNKNAISEKTYN